MKNGQKSEMRRERKMTFDDFNEDPFDGFSSESFFQNSNINVDDFFRTPERRAGRGFTSTTSSSSSSGSGLNSNNFNNARANMFDNIDKDFDFDFPSKNMSSSSFTRSTNSRNNQKNQSSDSDNKNKEPSGNYSVSIPLGSNIEPEDLKITLKDHQMTIEVKKEAKSQGRGNSYQEFKKQFNLPLNVDMKQVKSVLTTDGNLKIEAPYTKSA